MPDIEFRSLDRVAGGVIEDGAVDEGPLVGLEGVLGMEDGGVHWEEGGRGAVEGAEDGGGGWEGGCGGGAEVQFGGYVVDEGLEAQDVAD